MLRRFLRMMNGVEMMPVCGMRMMSSFFVMTRVMVLSRFSVMMGRVFVMGSCFLVMAGCFL
jgi:hypothetical protein